ncbi:hypothetical protein IEQ34_011206 [Dendrobium chrysotoxum]|uniref:Uncharacterized protein n=1 Tax=Dendrobium chrysotoxum TaxID=161865 RepID=A0AAV7GY29_DENCH|nr:hypothetical protein IEQ34_011206 [Dendrobium chrysotoxum]
MNLRRAVTPFLRGLSTSKGSWRCTTGSWCEFELSGFSETSKIYVQRGGREGRPLTFVGIGGSGIVIDSKGTILTLARNIFSLYSRSKEPPFLSSGEAREQDSSASLTQLWIPLRSPTPRTLRMHTEETSKNHENRTGVVAPQSQCHCAKAYSSDVTSPLQCYSRELSENRLDR